MARLDKKERRALRHKRIRRTVSGTAERPRMTVCRSAKHIHIQFVDDERGHTLAAASTVDKAFRDSQNKANVAGAAFLGKLAAERAAAVNVKCVVFDRSGFKYHGCVKAIADSARAAGLEF